MEEIFKNIKYHMENHYEEAMVDGGMDPELVTAVKNLHLSNIVKILEVASVYDANGFTTEEVIVEAGDYLESCYLDFKKIFPLVDFEMYDKK